MAQRVRIVGRDRELAAVARCLDAAQSDFAAVVLEGEAGIGKTTVWLEAVRMAEQRGMRVLACRTAQAEAKLAFASLTDLLVTVEPEIFDELPEPQRHALAVAMLRESPRERSSQSRAVSAGVVSVLRALAERSPVLVAIDDVQWVDRTSAAVLAFAIRRLRGCRVAALVAERVSASQRADVLELATAGAEIAELEPLSLSSLFHVLRQELQVVLPRPTLQRIEQASGGNPFFALQLAEALRASGGRLRPGEPLPVPTALADLVQDRLRRLPEGTRDALIFVASSSSPSIALMERAGLGLELEPALTEGVVAVRDGSLRFSHPLLADAVVARASPARRRLVHCRLAELVEHPEEQARHLALGAESYDEAIALHVELAAEQVGRRGSPEAAAELLELSSRLTPPDDQVTVDRRTLLRGRVLHRAGDTSEARNLLEALAAKAASNALRAQALERLAHIAWVSGSAEEAAELCLRALDLVGDDVPTRARVVTTLARVSLDAQKKLERARAAVELIEGRDDADPALLSEALLSLAEATFQLDQGLPEAVIERALELERLAPPLDVGDRISAALGVWLKHDGDFEGARRWLDQTLQAAIDEGDEGSLPFALSHLPQLELWIGDWEAAERRALEHLELAERTDQAAERRTAVYSLTSVLAHRGAVDDVRSWIADTLPEAERVDDWSVYQLMGVLGFVELSLGNVPEAVRALARASEIYGRLGYGDLSWVYENLAEALVLHDALGRAEELVDWYEARARERGKPMSLGSALRCRALLLAAQGKLAAAAEAADEAVENGRRTLMPFGLARTLVVRGQILRRRGERKAARDALDEAVTIFGRLGAPLWEGKARAELARVPIKRKAGAVLTAAETRIAEMVARGSSNKDVALALFLSEKTVEANLTRVYRKLGVQSRTALAARLANLDGG